MAKNDEGEIGGSRFVIDYEVEFDSPPDAQREAVTAANPSGHSGECDIVTELDSAVMCAQGCSGCSAECAACASGCAGCAGCDSARLAAGSVRARVAIAVMRLLGLGEFAFDVDQLRDRRGRWVKDPRDAAPSLPRASEGGGAGAGGGGRRRTGRAAPKRGPLNDEEFQARADHVDRTMSSAIKEHSTDRRYAPGGVWTPERDRMHREIADALYAKAADVPNEGKAVMAGGLGGAGKSTVLRDYAGIDSSQYLTVNPDDVKEELVRRGLVPEVPGAEDLSPLERSALVHEESSRIAQMVAQKAYADRKNLIWDITMSSQPSIDSRVAAMRGAGYSNIDGVFVDIPTEVSVDRAMSRYRRGIDDYLGGKGNGGRYVPPRIIRAQQTSGGSTVNRDSFDNSRGQFDGWSVYDNSVTGRAPQLVDKS